MSRARRKLIGCERTVDAQDTALGFEALGGLPGPYIKYFMKSVGHEGELLQLPTPENERNLIPLPPSSYTGLNNMLAGFPSKRATAICTFAYSAGPGTEPIIFEGRTEGKIVPARGPSNFGWDPVFEPEEGNGLT